MRKRKWIALVTVLSLALNTVCVPGTRNAQAGSSGIHTLKRVISGQNKGLLRYQYVDEEGNELDFSSNGSASSRKRAAKLPSSYDSRSAQVVTSIKDQGVTGGCWAFGALKALESTSIINGISSVDDTDYSENHLIWYSYHPLSDSSDPLYGDYTYIGRNRDTEKYNYGGNALIAAFTLANWWGAVPESLAPFTADTQTELNRMAASMSSADETLRTQSDIHLTEANCYDYASLDEIKQAVVDYGSLDVAFYYDTTNQYTQNDITSYYQDQRGDMYANHCVAIVGWDDDFDSFKKKAPDSGAWLIANSYGTESGMDGYFWLSYYDTSLCEFYSFEGEISDTYDTNFQYDGAGWNEGYYDTDDIALANVFTNGEDSCRQIEAVSFYTLTDSQKYSIEVYRNLNSSMPTDGEHISKCTVSGTAERNGYHTVSLTEPFAVGPEESFSVIVTFQPSEETDNMAYALIEGETSPRDSLYYNSSAGQSYVYFASEGKWYDNTSVTDENDRTADNNNNVCVKAFGNTISQEYFEELEKDYIPETPSPTIPKVPEEATASETPIYVTASETPSGTTASEIPVNTTASGAPTDITSPAAPDRTANAPVNTPNAAAGADVSDNDTGNPSDTKLILAKSKLIIGKGETVTIPVTTTPASSKKQLAYSSSNKKAVVKSNGKITGKKKGKATITITAPDKTQKKLTVQVKKAPSTLRLKAAKTELKKGKTTQLTTKLNTGSASYSLTYQSTNPKIVSVSQNGKVKAKKTGEAWITVRTYNNKTARIKIVVRI